MEQAQNNDDAIIDIRVLIELYTFGGFAKKRISELKPVNIAQKLMRGRMFN